ncbi:MAG: hypothetical protein GY756_10035 [bacterium]|nr:hypothetical protein [bacterium]
MIKKTILLLFLIVSIAIFSFSNEKRPAGISSILKDDLISVSGEIAASETSQAFFDFAGLPTASVRVEESSTLTKVTFWCLVGDSGASQPDFGLLVNGSIVATANAAGCASVNGVSITSFSSNSLAAGDWFEGYILNNGSNNDMEGATWKIQITTN